MFFLYLIGLLYFFLNRLRDFLRLWYLFRLFLSFGLSEDLKCFRKSSYGIFQIYLSLKELTNLIGDISRAPVTEASDNEWWTLFRISDLKERVFMGLLSFTGFTIVEVFTCTTFVTNTNHWEGITAITTYMSMSDFGYYLDFRRYFGFFLDLRFLLLNLWFNNYTPTYLFDYLRKHTSNTLFDYFEFLLNELVFNLMPFTLAFFFGFLKVNKDWVSIRVDCQYYLTCLTFQWFLEGCKIILTNDVN